jgi:16S rRNA (uracil1498-N3)-methyltransferase
LQFVSFGFGKIEMHRFFVNEKYISSGQLIIADSRVHQIRDVLRMKTGDEIIVLDNTGFEYQVRLSNISPKEVIGEIIQKKENETEPHTKITLYQSLLAREKFEFVLQKCTEIGVSCFVPVITERSIIRKAEKITKQKTVRFESIILEAAEQSARGKIPLFRSPIDLSEAISELDSYDVCFAGSTRECLSLRNILPDCKTSPKNIALFIGPEGGFSERELEILSRVVKFFSLGKRILRTETAAVVASAVILYELE